MNTTKKILLGVGLVAMVAVGASLLSPSVDAQPVPGYFGPGVAVSSSSTTATNAHFGLTTNGIWPSTIIGTDIVTNFTKVDVSSFRDLSIQLSASANVSIGAVASQTAVLTVYRSISGGSPTNFLGGNLLFDTLGTITLPLTSSTSGPWTVCSNYCNAVSPIAGITTLYIGKLDLTSMTNGAFLTNYTVRVNGK